MGEFGRSGMSPVREGEEMEVTIEAVGAKGDGIAKKNGFVLFVPNTKEGDKVRIRITKVFRKVGFAEVIGEGSEEEPKEEAESEEPSEEEEEEPKEEAESEEPSEEEEEEPVEESEDSEEFGEEEK